MSLLLPKSVCLILLLVLFPLFSQATEVATAIDQLILTYGGEDKLRRTHSMTQKWDLLALMGNRQGTDSRSIRMPEQLRVDLKYPKKTETRIINGDIAHVIYDLDSSSTVSRPQRDAMRLQLMRLYSPLVLRNKINAISLTEKGEMLVLTLLENDLQVDYLINKKNWHIEKVVGKLKMGPTEMLFLTEYSDFAMTEDGVLMHHKENKYAGGVNTAVLTLQEVVFDAALSDEVFKP